MIRLAAIGFSVAISLSAPACIEFPDLNGDCLSAVADCAGLCVEGVCEEPVGGDVGQPYSADFSTDPEPDWRIYRLQNDLAQEAYWDPSNGWLYLTKPDNDLAVGMFLARGLTSTRWHAEFDFFSGGGTGADGIVFMFYKDEACYLDYELVGGGGLGFILSDADGVELPCEGLGVEFDNYDNENYGDPSENHIALVRDDVANHLVAIDAPLTEDEQWHHATILFDEGDIEVLVDGAFAFKYFLGDVNYDHSGVGLGAGTGGETHAHIIDNFELIDD